MRLDDFILLRFLSHFNALQQSNRNNTQKPGKPDNEDASPSVEDSHTAKEPPTTHPEDEY